MFGLDLSIIVVENEMAHNHHHHNSGGNLKIAFFVNLAFTIIEVFAGFFVNSVAILSDAVHDLGDSMSLGLAWYLDKKSKQKPDATYSFGYARFSLLGAVINSLVLLISSGFVIYEAIGRIVQPEHTDAQGMMYFAFLGIAVNGYAAWKVSGGKTLNERVVSWHLLEDVLGWVAILIVSIVLQFKDIPVLDPILSLAITVYILWNVGKRLIETTRLFLQATPEDVSVEEIEKELNQLENVSSVHHTHIWSLEGEQHVFSTHVRLKEFRSIDDIISIKKQLRNTLLKYKFKDSTIEIELSDSDCSDTTTD